MPLKMNEETGIFGSAWNDRSINCMPGSWSNDLGAKNFSLVCMTTSAKALSSERLEMWMQKKFQTRPTETRKNMNLPYSIRMY